MADSFNELFGLGSHSPDADLEGWWPLQDDAASTVVVDQLGANNGTLAGGDNTADLSVTGPNGWLTKALDFDGTNDYVDVGLADYLDGVSGLTAMVSVNLDVQADNKALISDWANSGNGHILFRQETTGGDLGVFVNDTTQTGGTVSPATKLTISAGWQNASMRWNGTVLTGGTDGTYATTAASGTTLTSTNTSNLRFGSSQHTFGVESDGQFCNVSIFSRALTDAEISERDDGPELINSVAPAMTQVGETLSVTTGTWVLDAPFSGGSNGTATYAYQWTRSNDAGGTGEADISGATSNTYTLVEADKGKFIRCRVRASNDGGFDPAADTNSNMSGAIVAGDIARPKVGASLANRTPLLGGLAA